MAYGHNVADGNAADSQPDGAGHIDADQGEGEASWWRPHHLYDIERLTLQFSSFKID
jgi:hypothetical protein